MSEATARRLMAALTLMLAGRVMTLAFVARAGDGGAGDPPAAWLMPLVGDAIIGLACLALGVVLLRGAVGPGLRTGVLLIHTLAIWDAASAMLIHLTVPWEAFFMIELFGVAMFPMAGAMHGFVLWLASSSTGRASLLGPQVAGVPAT